MAASIRFGVYELDREAMELRKHGVLLRLQDQPFRVLSILASRPGEIVTREELQEQIWGNTFVDFDQSLNKAVNRVREALNDNAGTPQYIETVPRRGYRFIAPVAALPLKQAETPKPGPAPAEVPAESHRPRFSTILIASLTVGVVLAIAVPVWFRHSKKSTLPEPRLISSFGVNPTLSRDGKLLAYSTSLGAGMVRVWVQQTAGGEASPVTTGSDADLDPELSPDGTHIAFVSGRNGGGIYITSTLPGEPRLLVGTPYGDYPRFSPSGDTILYWQDQKAFTVSARGGPPVALPVDQDFLLHGPPLWAPNGKEILFYGLRNHDQSKQDNWWIAPLTAGPPRLARIPGVEQNFMPAYAVLAWVRTADGREWIIYSTASRENFKLWRVRVSPQGAIDEDRELLASGNGMLGIGGSASEDGKLAYNIWSSSESIYEVAINDRGQKLGATFQLPLSEGTNNNNNFPAVSRDGKWMAYENFTIGRPDAVLLRDLITGTDHLVDDKDQQGSFGGTSISPDGSRLIFERACREGILPENSDYHLPCSYMASASGGEAEQVCVLCIARGFSSDGAIVLLQKYDKIDPSKNRIVALDLRTRTEHDFLSLPDQPVYHAFFSWDDRWVVFKSMQPHNLPPSQILIAPMREGSPAGRAEWIAVTDGKHADDKPQFSSDGNTVYFTSTRDGYLCIWAQRLDPATKRPLGPPFAFEHFHNSEGSAGVFLQAASDLSVARDKILINLPRLHSETWMTQMP